MSWKSNLWTISLIAGCVFTATAAMPFVRIGSGPLNASVENERDAAIDRAVSWLVAAQSPEGHWGGSNVVATAAAALAVRGDRAEMPEAEAEAVERAVRWLGSSICTNALASEDQTTDLPAGESLQRARAWRHLVLAVLQPGADAANGVSPEPLRNASDGKREAFDALVSAALAETLARLLEGSSKDGTALPGRDAASLFIVATFVDTPPAEVLKPLAENLAGTWNETMPAVWLSNPEAGWWLARAINGATGGNLPLPADAEGHVRNINWRGIMAGTWINSQRIDRFGNGHWDDDAEKTAFAVLLLNEM